MRYEIQYWLLLINGAVLVIATVLAGSGLTLHPSWLTDDVIATAAILVPICGAFAHFLPQVTRTPATRDSRYLAAMAGALPEDVAKKHGLTVTRDGDHIDVSSPEKPLDTL